MASDPNPTPAPAPTPAAKPPEQQAPAQPLTPEQQEIENIRKATSFLAGQIIKPEPPKPKEKAKVEEPAPAPAAKEDEPKKVEAPPSEPKPKPVRKAKAEPAPVQSMSPEQIAQLAANTAIEVTKRKAQAEPEPETEDIQLAEEFAANRQYYEWMQRENPRKYGKLIKQIADWGPKEMEYSEQWERDNPGRKYDPDSEEHDEFYSQNQPKIDPEDLQHAKVQVAQVQESLKEDKLRKKILEEISPELNEIRKQKIAHEAAPKLQAAAQSAIDSILEGINPDYVQHSRDKAKLDEIAEADPIAADVGRELAGQFVPLATEIVAFHRGIPFDKNNPAHVAMYYRTIDLENRVANLPPEKQIHEGRRFTTQEQYSQMTPQQKAQHWIIGEDDLLFDLASEAKRTAAALYKRESDKMARWTKKNPPANATNGKHAKVEETPKPTARSSAPSVVPSPAVTPGASGTQNQSKSGSDRFHERLVGVR